MVSVRRTVLAACLLCVALLASAFAAQAASKPDKAKLDELAEYHAGQLAAHRGAPFLALLRSEQRAQKALGDNPSIKLMYVNDRGRPVYYGLDNLTAAATVSTKKVWPSGGLGYSMTGSGTAVGELGIWDGGSVRATHQELTGRVTQVDSPGSSSAHATHVAGTMIAGGVVAAAKGMSYQADLTCYDYDNDNAEMATAAAGGMKASNHSYTTIVGWYYHTTGEWYWFGDTDISETEDYYFGFYDSEAQAWDQIAVDAPHYTIVGSTGNNRDEPGPGAGGGHWVWDNVGGEWVWSTTTRDPDGGTDGYDSIAHTKIAKNVLSIGAVNDIAAGYSVPGDVVMTSFSCWGPTDDGRIKPDLVANGVGLYSCINTNNSAYASYGGTSMSGTNFTGSLNLLVNHYENTHGGTTPLSSTMKAVLIQTADEVGASTGPDYKFGWGLLNTYKAANLIKSDSTESFWIREDTLSSAEKDTFYVYNAATAAIRLTLAWTDPPGTPPAASLNPTTLMLVNDLDLRMERMATSTTYYPYVLDPANPGDAATTGDNTRDNIEQVYLAAAPVGYYRITVTHKSWLPDDQAYSLVASQKMTVGPPDLTAPEITVLKPNGGETYFGGTQHTIRWVATDNVAVQYVDILYSPNGGGTYPHMIATGETNDGEYLWAVPYKNSATAKVKVVAYDAAANQANDTSDSEFRLVVDRFWPEDVFGPEVTVLKPNGGEVFHEAAQDTIKWTATDEVAVDTVSIYYSTDGGSTYPHTIATGETNDGEYFWTTPATYSTTGKVRVVAYDWAENVGEGVSEADFTIAPPADVTPPEVTVVKPNGGELFYVASEDTIKWVATDNVGVDHVDIYYSTDGGNTYPYTVSTGEPNDSTYLWTIPATLSETCIVKVVAFDAELNSDADTSDAVFTIPDNTPPEVTVVRPNGAETLYVAEEDTIRWVATDDFGADSISLYYSTDGGATFPYTIATGEPNDSVYVWDVANTPSVTCIVKVVAYDTWENSSEDVSDAVFTIQTAVGVDEAPGAVVLGLSQNYPNPFNPLTRMEFSLGARSLVLLKVYDVSGKVVRTLVDEDLRAGVHSAVWDGNDDGGRPVASGVYVTRLVAEGKTVVCKNVLLR